MTDIRLTGRCGVTGKPVEIIVTPGDLQVLAGALQGGSAKDPPVKATGCDNCGAVVIDENRKIAAGSQLSGIPGMTLCRGCLEEKLGKCEGCGHPKGSRLCHMLHPTFEGAGKLEKEDLLGQIKKLQQSLDDANRMIKNRNDYIERQELSHASEMGELQRNLAAAEKLFEEEEAAKEEAEHKWITISDAVVQRLTVELYDMIYAGEDPKEREPRWKWVVQGVSSLIERVKSQEAELDVIQGKAEKAMRESYELQKKLDSAVAAGATEIQIADKLGAENKGLKEQVEALKEALKRSTVKAVCWDCRMPLYDATEVIRCVDDKDFCQKCFAARRTSKAKED